jgi:hypothetical protein
MSKKIKLSNRSKKIIYISDQEDLILRAKKVFNKHTNYIEKSFGPWNRNENLTNMANFVCMEDGWQYSIAVDTITKKLFIIWSSNNPSDWNKHLAPKLNKLVERYRYRVKEHQII